MLFKIKGKDYSSKIIEGSYEVNANDVYTTWTDANYTQHREFHKTRVKGSFEMYFPTHEDYSDFVSDINSARTTSGYYNLGIWVNNEDKFYQLKQLYVEFSPTRRQKVLGKAYYPSVTIKIEER